MDHEDSSPTRTGQYHIRSPDVAAAADEAVAYAPDVVSTVDVHLLQLPLFWNHNPGQWFTHAEAVMHAHCVRSDIQRANLVVNALDDDSMRAVANLLGPTVSYQSLKDRLIAVFDPVAPAPPPVPRPPPPPPRPRPVILVQHQQQMPYQQQQQMPYQQQQQMPYQQQQQFQQQQFPQQQQLQQHEVVRMPSQWLNELRKTMPENATDSMIRSFWMMRLTPAVRDAMTELDGPLDRLAACADHVMAVTINQEQQNLQQRCQHQHQHQQQQQQQQQQFGYNWQTDAERLRTLETTMIILSDQISALTVAVRALQQSNTRSPRSNDRRSRSRSRSKSTAQSSARSSVHSSGTESPSDMQIQQQGWCYYHSRYGHEARQCRPPCTFSPPLLL